MDRQATKKETKFVKCTKKKIRNQSTVSLCHGRIFWYRIQENPSIKLLISLENYKNFAMTKYPEAHRIF